MESDNSTEIMDDSTYISPPIRQIKQTMKEKRPREDESQQHPLCEVNEEGSLLEPAVASNANFNKDISNDNRPLSIPLRQREKYYNNQGERNAAHEENHLKRENGRRTRSTKHGGYVNSDHISMQGEDTNDTDLNDPESYDASAEESETFSGSDMSKSLRSHTLSQSPTEDEDGRWSGVHRMITHRSKLGGPGPVLANIRDCERAAELGGGKCYAPVTVSQTWSKTESQQESVDSAAPFLWQRNSAQVNLCHQKLAQDNVFNSRREAENHIMYATLGKSYLQSSSDKADSQSERQSFPYRTLAHPEDLSKDGVLQSMSFLSSEESTDSDRNMSHTKKIEKNSSGRAIRAKTMQKKLLNNKANEGNGDEHKVTRSRPDKGGVVFQTYNGPYENNRKERAGNLSKNERNLSKSRLEIIADPQLLSRGQGENGVISKCHEKSEEKYPKHEEVVETLSNQILTAQQRNARNHKVPEFEDGSFSPTVNKGQVSEVVRCSTIDSSGFSNDFENDIANATVTANHRSLSKAAKLIEEIKEKRSRRSKNTQLQPRNECSDEEIMSNPQLTARPSGNSEPTLSPRKNQSHKKLHSKSIVKSPKRPTVSRNTQCKNKDKLKDEKYSLDQHAEIISKASQPKQSKHRKSSQENPLGGNALQEEYREMPGQEPHACSCHGDTDDSTLQPPQCSCQPSKGKITPQKRPRKKKAECHGIMTSQVKQFDRHPKYPPKADRVQQNKSAVKIRNRRSQSHESNRSGLLAFLLETSNFLKPIFASYHFGGIPESVSSSSSTTSVTNKKTSAKIKNAWEERPSSQKGVPSRNHGISVLPRPDSLTSVKRNSETTIRTSAPSDKRMKNSEKLRSRVQYKKTPNVLSGKEESIRRAGNKVSKKWPPKDLSNVDPNSPSDGKHDPTMKLSEGNGMNNLQESKSPDLAPYYMDHRFIEPTLLSFRSRDVSSKSTEEVVDEISYRLYKLGQQTHEDRLKNDKVNYDITVTSHPSAIRKENWSTNQAEVKLTQGKRMKRHAEKPLPRSADKQLNEDDLEAHKRHGKKRYRILCTREQDEAKVEVENDMLCEVISNVSPNRLGSSLPREKKKGINSKPDRKAVSSLSATQIQSKKHRRVVVKKPYRPKRSKKEKQEVPAQDEDQRYLSALVPGKNDFRQAQEVEAAIMTANKIVQSEAQRDQKSRASQDNLGDRKKEEEPQDKNDQELSTSLENLFTALDNIEKQLVESGQSMRRQHQEGNIYRLLRQDTKDAKCCPTSLDVQNDAEDVKHEMVNVQNDSEMVNAQNDTNSELNKNKRELKYLDNNYPVERSRSRILEILATIGKQDEPKVLQPRCQVIHSGDSSDSGKYTNEEGPPPSHWRKGRKKTTDQLKDVDASPKKKVSPLDCHKAKIRILQTDQRTKTPVKTPGSPSKNQNFDSYQSSPPRKSQRNARLPSPKRSPTSDHTSIPQSILQPSPTYLINTTPNKEAETCDDDDGETLCHVPYMRNDHMTKRTHPYANSLDGSNGCESSPEEDEPIAPTPCLYTAPNLQQLPRPIHNYPITREFCHSLGKDVGSDFYDDGVEYKIGPPSSPNTTASSRRVPLVIAPDPVMTPSARVKPEKVLFKDEMCHRKSWKHRRQTSSRKTDKHEKHQVKHPSKYGDERQALDRNLYQHTLLETDDSVSSSEGVYATLKSRSHGADKNKNSDADKNKNSDATKPILAETKEDSKNQVQCESGYHSSNSSAVEEIIGNGSDSKNVDDGESPGDKRQQNTPREEDKLCLLNMFEDFVVRPPYRVQECCGKVLQTLTATNSLAKRGVLYDPCEMKCLPGTLDFIYDSAACYEWPHSGYFGQTATQKLLKDLRLRHVSKDGGDASKTLHGMREGNYSSVDGERKENEADENLDENCYNLEEDEDDGDEEEEEDDDDDEEEEEEEGEDKDENDVEIDEEERDDGYTVPMLTSKMEVSSKWKKEEEFGNEGKQEEDGSSEGGKRRHGGEGKGGGGGLGRERGDYSKIVDVSEVKNGRESKGNFTKEGSYVPPSGVSPQSKLNLALGSCAFSLRSYTNTGNVDEHGGSGNYYGNDGDYNDDYIKEEKQDRNNSDGDFSDENNDIEYFDYNNYDFINGEVEGMELIDESSKSLEDEGDEKTDEDKTACDDTHEDDDDEEPEEEEEELEDEEEEDDVEDDYGEESSDGEDEDDGSQHEPKHVNEDVSVLEDNNWREEDDGDDDDDDDDKDEEDEEEESSSLGDDLENAREQGCSH